MMTRQLPYSSISSIASWLTSVALQPPRGTCTATEECLQYLHRSRENHRCVPVLGQYRSPPGLFVGCEAGMEFEHHLGEVASHRLQDFAHYLRILLRDRNVRAAMDDAIHA